jgi:galactokinase
VAIEPTWGGALRSRFAEVFGPGTCRLAAAPGRVNLIGEHTDYNDGFVFPMAIDRNARLAFAARPDRRLRAHSVAFGETRELELREIQPPGGSEWIAYVAGVAWAMADAGFDPAGIDLVLDGDVPLGAGLSSSAAVEMATARALCAVSGIPWEAARMARLGQRAENRFVGVNCGLMDQLASAACQEGSALLLDCRSLESRAVPIPGSARVVVMDTGARRSLAGSAYNERRRSCEAAVATLRRRHPEVRALRDVDEARLLAARDELDPVALRRARHVVVENERPLRMAEALGAGDLAGAGRLMNDSHASLRDLYEVSSPELDRITELARRHPACYGARLTGAGFGGCAVALVRADQADDFSTRVHRDYQAEVELQGDFFVTAPSAGARVFE